MLKNFPSKVFLQFITYPLHARCNTSHRSSPKSTKSTQQVADEQDKESSNENVSKDWKQHTTAVISRVEGASLHGCCRSLVSLDRKGNRFCLPACRLCASISRNSFVMKSSLCDRPRRRRTYFPWKRYALYNRGMSKRVSNASAELMTEYLYYPYIVLIFTLIFLV